MTIERIIKMIKLNNSKLDVCEKYSDDEGIDLGYCLLDIHKNITSLDDINLNGNSVAISLLSDGKFDVDNEEIKVERIYGGPNEYDPDQNIEELSIKLKHEGKELIIKLHVFYGCDKIPEESDFVEEKKAETPEEELDFSMF